MEEKKFKAQHRPASCTQPPWAAYIEADKREQTLYKIRQECLEIYGESFDECSKRMVCLAKTCIGRKLPWNSPTAKPYLELMKQHQNIRNDELILTNCDLCPIFKVCKSTCAQVNDFMNRDRVAEPELSYRETLDNMEIEPVGDIVSRVLGGNIKVPWDAINATRRGVIKKYLYEQKNFLTVANEMGLTDQNRARYEFYAGLTTMSEYGVFRAFLEENGDSLTKLQKDVILMVYVGNISLVNASKVLGISKQAVNQVIKRVIQKYGIHWKTFVKKQGKKVVYFVPEILK